MDCTLFGLMKTQSHTDSIGVTESRGPTPTGGRGCRLPRKGQQARQTEAAGPSFQSPGAVISARGAATIAMWLSPPISQCQGTGYQSLPLLRQ